MDKKRTDKLLPFAVEALETNQDSCMVENGKIDKSLRGQISSFGAAISFGSLLAATAFFNEQGQAKSPRHKLMAAINSMLKESEEWTETGKTLFDTVKNAGPAKEKALKEKILCCAVALKLAMNLFELDDSDKSGKVTNEVQA